MDMASRSQRLEKGLVPMGEDYQPQWDERGALKDRMEVYGVPGVGIAVIQDFQVVWAEGYGSLRAGGEIPVTATSLFHAGSTAKPISAAAALALVEKGRLALDEDLAAKLKSWRIPESQFTRQEKVTLRRLLSHSAGIEDGFTNRSAADAMPDYLTPAGVAPAVTIQQLLAADAGIDVDGPARVTAVPGSRYRYANADYAILELLIGDVTGQQFPEFMQATILAPLGMAASTFQQPLPPALRVRATMEHDHAGQAIAGDRLHIPLLAAGGLWTTPSDMALFLVEIMQSHAGRSQRILSSAMVGEMLSKQIEIPENPLADAAGLGFELSGEGREFSMVHTGGTWGSTCIIWAYPETGQGAVIMTNSATGSLLRFEILMGIAMEFDWPMNP